jgi:hypothetical protein
METNQSNNISARPTLARQMPENATMNPGYETMKAGTGNTSSGLEAGPHHGAVEVHAPVPTNAPTPNVTGSVHNAISNPPSNNLSIPPESLAHAGGVYGLYDAFSLHPGVWFIFGCIFIVVLMIVREIYYKKRAK